MDNTTIQNEYWPDSVSPPGETLKEILEERGMSQAELARRMELPTQTVGEIIQGKAAIASASAILLERELGASAQFWLNREQQYHAPKQVDRNSP